MASISQRQTNRRLIADIRRRMLVDGNHTKLETIEKLISLGVPRATVYRNWDKLEKGEEITGRKHRPRYIGSNINEAIAEQLATEMDHSTETDTGIAAKYNTNVMMVSKVRADNGIKKLKRTLISAWNVSMVIIFSRFLSQSHSSV